MANHIGKINEVCSVIRLSAMLAEISLSVVLLLTERFLSRESKVVSWAAQSVILSDCFGCFTIKSAVFFFFKISDERSKIRDL